MQCSAYSIYICYHKYIWQKTFGDPHNLKVQEALRNILFASNKTGSPNAFLAFGIHFIYLLPQIYKTWFYCGSKHVVQNVFVVAACLTEANDRLTKCLSSIWYSLIIFATANIIKLGMSKGISKPEQGFDDPQNMHTPSFSFFMVDKQDVWYIIYITNENDNH